MTTKTIEFLGNTIAVLLAIALTLFACGFIVLGIGFFAYCFEKIGGF